MKSQSPFKFLWVAFFLLTAACSDDTPDDVTNENTSGTVAASCDNELYGIYMESPNVNMQLDASSLIFNDADFIQGERLGHLDWDYPGWMGSSSVTFQYPNEGLAVGVYDIISAGAVLDFNGSGGTMLVCPCENFVLEITDLNEDEGYCCGTVSGMATNQNNELVQIDGSFKAFLDGE